MEKKLREIANAIIDYVIEENLPIQLDNIYIYNNGIPLSKAPWDYATKHNIYPNVDSGVVIDYLFGFFKVEHFFVIYGLTEEEFNGLVDNNKLRKGFL